SGPDEADEGEIKLSLFCAWANQPLQKVGYETGKPPPTRFTVIARDAIANTTRIKLEPVSGRPHHLRVHMLSLRHPLVGDQLYAPDDVKAMAPRLLLHASHIHLRHPTTGAAIAVDCAAEF